MKTFVFPISQLHQSRQWRHVKVTRFDLIYFFSQQLCLDKTNSIFPLESVCSGGDMERSPASEASTWRSFPSESVSRNNVTKQKYSHWNSWGIFLIMEHFWERNPVHYR